MAWNTAVFLQTTLTEVYNRSVISNLVNNVAKGDAGRVGGTIEFRKSIVPTGVDVLTQAQRDADTPLRRQKLVDAVDSLTLSDRYYKRVVVNSDFRTFADYNWKTEIAVPSAAQIAAERDFLVTSTIVDEVDAVAVAVDPRDGDAVLAFVRETVREEVSAAGAPDQGRVLAVGIDIYSALLGTREGSHADVVADNGNALRTANLGVKYGFTIVEDRNLPRGHAVAFDAEAVVLGSAPSGKSSAAKESDNLRTEEGLAVGYSFGWDPNLDEDNVITSVYMGAKVAVPSRVKHYALSA